jgi:hypothetical protein
MARRAGSQDALGEVSRLRAHERTCRSPWTLIAPVAVERFALFAPISWGLPPLQGSQPVRDRVEFPPDVAASRPEALRRLRFNKFRLIHVSTSRVGSYFRTKRTTPDTAHTGA